MTKSAIENNVFYHELKVYWDDLDDQGVVYHPNYMKFLERARTEHLDYLHFPFNKLAEEFQTTFMLKNYKLDYIRPARFGDILRIGTEVIKVGKASLVDRQVIMRGEEKLLEAEMKFAMVDMQGKPKAMPKEFKENCEKFMLGEFHGK